MLDRLHTARAVGESVSEASLLNSLNEYRIIMPRNPLKKIMSASFESWEVLAYQPSRDGPLFIDRFKSYPTNDGTVGILFEAAMTTAPVRFTYHRVYAVSRTTIGDMSVLLTGEVDCVDENSDIVELKTKPVDARSAGKRKMDNWIQSKLIGTKTIVTGSFTGKS